MTPIRVLLKKAYRHIQAQHCAQAEYWEADHFAGRVQGMLAETAEATSRAWMLAEAAEHSWWMYENHDTAFGTESRCCTEGDHWSSYLLLAKLAQVERHVADGTAWFTDLVSTSDEERRIHAEANPILDRMAATPDLDERMDLLENLYDAVYPLVGGQAAEALATLPAPGRYGWHPIPAYV